jgi:hypothetical protein
MQSSFAVAVPGWAATAAYGATTALEAYAGASSVKQGAQISFFARDPAGTTKRDVIYGFQITRISAQDQSMLSTTVKVRNRSVPANASTAGCGWPLTYTLAVPSSWPSGLYYASFGTGTKTCHVPFVVAAATRTAGANVLVQVPVTTAQAYNNYGGKSLYAYNSTSGVPAVKVSFDRPHFDPMNFAFDPWQAPLVRWLARNGVAADFCTSVDLHANTSVLSGYQLFITAGHDEYWSRDMRSRLDTFVAAGGNAAIFSGNTCWWQVRFEASSAGANRTMVCYKSSTADPDTRAAYKTNNWISLVPPNPENSTIGLGWNLGASWTNALPRPNTPFVVQRGEHWAFAGTGLASGAAFGGAYVGYEIDALAFRRGADARVYPTWLDGTPSTMTVLAWADASTWDAQAKALGQSGEKSGYGAIGIFSRGGAAGAVFNVGTIDWVAGLQPELDGQTPTPLSQITRNVVTRLAARYVESADVRQWRNVQSNGDGARLFYSLDNDAPSGATLDGKVFRAYPAAGTGTVPVYRYKFPQANGDGVRYLYSLNAGMAAYGWTPDGTAFHAYASAQAGTAAVYQHHVAQANGDGWRFLYSPNLSEPGWIFDDVAFFAPLT